MSVHVTSAHLARAERLVARARAHDGLAPLDTDAFWAAQDRAMKDPWAADLPLAPMGLRMSSECMFDELRESEDWYRLQHDGEYRTTLERRYNDLAQRIVGRRLFGESLPNPQHRWPTVGSLADLFEARNEWRGWSYWLKQAAHTPDELAALLDRVEQRLATPRAWLLPPCWAEEKVRLTALGRKPALYRSQRGPVTFAMSVYGVENLIFLIADRPELAARFRDLIRRAMLERARVLDEEAGYTPETAPRGFYFLDDNCALLNAEMYEFFGYPILQGVFARHSPGPAHQRGQHSDSDMAHLLPLLGRLGMTLANFGPNLTVSQIREHLPRAVIHGQLAPFTFSRHEEINMVAEFFRDAEMARERRGLVFATAGGVNAGSRLVGLRLIMAAIQEFGPL
jgi:uroporphyrinogen decarboxylase